MNYNEKEFAKIANKKAMFMWILMSVVLSAAYVFEVLKGAKTLTYYLIMLFFCLGTDNCRFHRIEDKRMAYQSLP